MLSTSLGGPGFCLRLYVVKIARQNSVEYNKHLIRAQGMRGVGDYSYTDINSVYDSEAGVRGRLGGRMVKLE